MANPSISLGSHARAGGKFAISRAGFREPPNLSSQAAIWKMLFSRGGAQTDGHEQGKTAQACHASQARCPDRGWYAGQLRLAKQARAANPSRSWRMASRAEHGPARRDRDFTLSHLLLFRHRA